MRSFTSHLSLLSVNLFLLVTSTSCLESCLPDYENWHFWIEGQFVDADSQSPLEVNSVTFRLIRQGEIVEEWEMGPVETDGSFSFGIGQALIDFYPSDCFKDHYSRPCPNADRFALLIDRGPCVEILTFHVDEVPLTEEGPCGISVRFPEPVEVPDCSGDK